MESLNYDNIISQIDRIFPELAKAFNLKELTEEVPGVHLGFLISYAREHWQNDKLQVKLAEFVDVLGDSKDDATKITFQDFALDFQLHFREHEVNMDAFLNLLKSKTKSDFMEALNFWDTANKINKKEDS